MSFWVNTDSGFIFLCRSHKNQSALCTKHSEHVCPCAWRVHRWAADHDVRQVKESFYSFYVPSNKSSRYIVNANTSICDIQRGITGVETVRPCWRNMTRRLWAWPWSSSPCSSTSALIWLLRCFSTSCSLWEGTAAPVTVPAISIHTVAFHH